MAIIEINGSVGEGTIFKASFDNVLMKMTSLYLSNPSKKRLILSCTSPIVFSYITIAGETRTIDIPTAIRPTWKWETVSIEEVPTQVIGGAIWGVTLGN